MKRKEIFVLGAGAVGVCTALYLQRDGHSVTLVDSDDPGAGATLGNAGIIQCASVVPLANRGVLRQIPKMLFARDQPLVIRWQYLPSLFPYLVRFIAAASPARVEAISRALTSIIPRAYEAYKPLVEAAGIQNQVRQSGELHVFESMSAYQNALFAFDMRRERGVDVQVLDQNQLREFEPALAHTIRVAVLLPAAYQTINPFRFINSLAKDFVSKGGVVLRNRVTNIEIGPDGPTELAMASGCRLPVQHLVLAMGAYSRAFARKLGSDVPINSERGYHAMVMQPNLSLRASVISGDSKFAIVPMDGGARLAGTVELARVGAPPDYSRATRLLPLARKIVPELESATIGTTWMGHRPSTPDSLPVIGRSPRFPTVYFAFGHNHSGLTLGGITGRLIADLVAERRPLIDLEPFSASRFGGLLSLRLSAPRLAEHSPRGDVATGATNQTTRSARHRPDVKSIDAR